MKKKGIALVERQYLFPFVLITSLFFLWGFAHAILDVLNKHFQELLTITRTHSAMIQATMYMGYFIMAIPAGLFINRHGYRKGVVLGLLLYGIGSLLFIPGQYIASFNMFLFSLFVIGCGLTFLETAANPYVTELGARETAASRLNFAQSFNGLGCIFAPILTGLLLFSDEDKGASGNVALPYAVMGVIVLLAALAASVFYFRLDMRFGLAMAALLAAMLVGGQCVAAQTLAVWLATGIGLFAVGWVIQFVGHYYEGRKPAFVDDLVGLIVGPLFVVAEWAFALGLRKEVQAAVEERSGPVRLRTGQQAAAHPQ